MWRAFGLGRVAAPLRRGVGAHLSSLIHQVRPGQTLVVHSELAEESRKPGAFAIIKFGGTQHKVTMGDTIVAEKMNVELGQELVLDEVLLLGTVHETVIGRPLVRDARVVVAVDEMTLDKKVIVFKKRKRKHSRRRRGFRRHITLLRVVDIQSDSLKLNHLPPPAAPKYYLPQQQQQEAESKEKTDEGGAPPF
ncbi:hypothetical protein CTAYLR_000199 [Chrysophaeum taylorii]|uniref:Large ribosomal subunit protein bL21m n=1 Tax=Chrysophaeum taylorii TaxID=2483200 RepID=A0AAD7XJ07_9STRA|nr:hypothetical protein CTAYLR_000199 [Chrysophaeum taylorii]